jgi:hypothetical protein
MIDEGYFLCFNTLFGLKNLVTNGIFIIISFFMMNKKVQTENKEKENLFPTTIDLML